MKKFQKVAQILHGRLLNMRPFGMRLFGAGLLGVAFLGTAQGDEYASANSSKFSHSLVKKGMYRSLGFYTGYHHYGEFGRDGSRFMRMDTATFGLMGQLGLAATSGLKLEGSARINYALGLYTGSILDTDNADRNGRKLHSITGALMGDVELKGGYNLLRGGGATSLYLQSGLGYFLNRTEFITMDRIQGYLYVPLELEGEAQLNARVALNYGAGYRYLVFGNHTSTASKYGFNDDYYVKQKSGFGANAFIGATYYNSEGALRSVRLIYEYWHIGAADPMRTSSSITGNETAIYEPENSTHRVLLQYSYGF